MSFTDDFLELLALVSDLSDEDFLRVAAADLLTDLLVQYAFHRDESFDLQV